MTARTLGSFALALTFICASRAQSGQPAAKVGVPECDRYAERVRSCAQKMCEDERMLVELELEFARETLTKVIELKGRDAAAKSCAEDIRRAVENDPYGCYTAGAGRAPPFRLDGVRPGSTSVAIEFSLQGTASADVFIGQPLERVLREYRVTGTQGRFVLDTASASPVGPGRVPAPEPVALEGGTTYCFEIRSPADEVNSTVLRKGTFTTRGKGSR